MPSKTMTIAALTHDLIRKRSIVALVWDDDAEKQVALPVPFGCALDRVQAEAEKAVLRCPPRLRPSRSSRRSSRRNQARGGTVIRRVKRPMIGARQVSEPIARPLLKPSHPGASRTPERNKLQLPISTAIETTAGQWPRREGRCAMAICCQPNC